MKKINLLSVHITSLMDDGSNNPVRVEMEKKTKKISKTKPEKIMVEALKTKKIMIRTC